MQPLARLCDVLIANPGAVATMLDVETAGTMSEPPDALRFAAAAGALKLTIPGDVNRVTVDEVDRLLRASE